MSNPARAKKRGVSDGNNSDGFDAVMVVASPVMVRVTAPSSLEEGYTFDAVYNGEVFPVTVPRGGVKAGQVFEVPFLPTVEAVAIEVGQSPEPIQRDQHHKSFDGHLSSETTPILQPLSTPPNNHIRINRQETPLGSWKTKWFDCLSEGCCHPSLCNAVCFPQILMGQVLTRMKLDHCGKHSGDSYKYTTRIWIILTIFLLYLNTRWKACLGEPSTTVWWNTLEIIADELDDDDDDMIQLREFRQHIHEIDSNHATRSNCTSDTADLLRTVHWVWFWITVVVLTRLRKAVRRAYGISRNFPCEDFFCSVLCGCCTVAQLARQTANYREQRAYCCTDTGLAEGWFGHRQEELERRHLHGHHLVHAHSYEQPTRREQQQEHTSIV